MKKKLLVIYCIFSFFTSVFAQHTERVVSSTTDYYRSAQSGDWDNILTWESSPDNINWFSATLTPTSAADIILIRTGHTVTVVSSVTVDQVEIQNGAVLENDIPAANILTVANGTGVDLVIKPGGTYLVSSGETYTNNFSISAGAVMQIENNGTIQIGNGGAIGGGNNAYAITSGSFVWDDGSIFRWNSSTTLSIQATFFPDAPAGIVPIFRFTTAPGVPLGGSTTPTIINGRLETTVPISFSGATTKTFRNGIINSAVIDGSVGTSLQFIINGATGILGGAGNIILPSQGLQVGSPSLVTLTADKTLTGNVSLLTLTNIDLGDFDLTVTGTVSNATVTSFVRTMGTGVLTLNTISTGAGGKIFPIGRSTINPLFVQSNTTANYSARVVEPITPPIVYPNYAVLRTWYISSSVVSPGAIIGFGYSYPGSDTGPNYTNAFPVEIGVHAGGNWNVLQGGLTPVPFPFVPGTYIVSNTVPMTVFTVGTEFPFVVGNSGAVLPLDYFIVARAQKQSNNGIISWNIHDADVVRNFEVQRMENGTYRTIATINPVTGQVNYSYTDVGLQNGTILYRVKVNRLSGDFRYSNTVAIINGSKGLMITSILPNPVQRSAAIELSVAKKGIVNFEVYNIAGQPVKRWTAAVAEGSNTITANFDGIPEGVYHVLAQNADSRTVFRFVKQ